MDLPCWSRQALVNSAESLKVSVKFTPLTALLSEASADDELKYLPPRWAAPDNQQPFTEIAHAALRDLQARVATLSADGGPAADSSPVPAP
jgi:hypothetical protein